MKCSKDFVLLRVYKKSENELQIGGTTLFLYDGKLAFNDGTYNPNDRIRIYGEVVSVPDRLGSDAMDFSYHKLQDCEMEVKVGDKAYFYYIAFNDENLIVHEDKMYLKVRYDSIICVVRDGEIKTIAGHVLITPKKSVESALLYSIEKIQSLTGIVDHVPSPYIGGAVDFTVGDTIHFFENSEFENEIEGKKYYVMRQEYIIAKVINQTCDCHNDPRNKYDPAKGGVQDSIHYCRTKIL
jgi:co-chaperonin GroES (HSP10)